MELNDDIETIRQQLMKAEWPHGGRGTLDNTLAALDRLKAELTRLEGLVTSLTAVNRNRRVELDATQAEVERLQQKYNTMKGKLTTEVEGLRAPYEVRHNQQVDEIVRLQREVERLRGERDIEYQRAEVFREENERLRDEVGEWEGIAVERLTAIERLRAEATHVTCDHAAEVVRLRADNDDYRAGNGALVQDLNETRKEVERLRNGQKELVLNNERLRDALTSANDDYADSKAEVERLRTEYKTLETTYDDEVEHYRVQFKRLTAENERLRKTVIEMTNEDVTVAELVDLRAEVERLKNEYARTENDNQRLRAENVTLQTRLNMTNETLADLEWKAEE